MSVIGIISWYDESPSWLSACVASMARVCSHVVAVDGRYAMFDADSAASPVEQTEAIVETAAGAGLALTLHRPNEPFFSNEVGKRNLTLQLALCHARPMRDWLLVLDGDCYISEHSEYLLLDLGKLEEHTAQVQVEEYLDVHDPEMPIAVAMTNDVKSVNRSPVTLLYRALDRMEYKGTHYSLGGYIEDEWVWLWGHDDAVSPANLGADIVVRHRNTQRSHYRRRLAATYYEKRDALNLEVRPSR